VSRLHPKCATNNFTLDERPLSDADLKILGSKNWIFGQSRSVDLPIYDQSTGTSCKGDSNAYNNILVIHLGLTINGNYSNH